MEHLLDYFNLSLRKEMEQTKKLELFLFTASRVLQHQCGLGQNFSMAAGTQCEFLCYQVMEQSQKI
jgi:hypothetical protein